MPTVWITKPLLAHFGAVVILLAFGVLVPVLVLSIILYFILESYVYQMVLGRFLVMQSGIVMEYKRDGNLSYYDGSVALTPNETIYFSTNKRESMHPDIEDIMQAWGAVAVLIEVEEQCSYMPASILSIDRTAFLIFPAITMAFTINDVLNDDRPEAKYWPWNLLLYLVLALELMTFAYNRYYETCKQCKKY